MWINLLRREASSSVICLVGNKIENFWERKVPYLEAIEFANKEKLSYFEFSAKDVVMTKLLVKKMIEMCTASSATLKK